MNEQNEPELIDAEKQIEISPLAYARNAYIGYAALARLGKESIDEGMSVIEAANEQQAHKLRLAFSSVAQVLLEMKGPMEIEATTILDSSKMVEEESSDVKAEAFQHSLHWVGKRYLSHLVGPVEDLELHVGHIPAIVELLVEMRGEPKRIERRSLDIEELLKMRFAGLSAEDIAISLKTKPNRVKGAFLRFSELIDQRATVDERSDMFRNRLMELNLFENKRHMTDEELDAHLSEKVLKKVSTAPNTRQIIEQKPIVQSQISQEASSYVLYEVPDDILPGETMGERRIRLREEAKKAE